MSEIRKQYDRGKRDIRAGCERDTNEVRSTYETTSEVRETTSEQGATKGRVKYETSEIQLHEGRTRNECENEESTSVEKTRYQGEHKAKYERRAKRRMVRKQGKSERTRYH